MAYSQWLPKSRRGSGSYVLNNIDIPSGIDAVRIKLDVTPTDFTTPDLSVMATVETSMDGVIWHHHSTVTWLGCDPEPRGPGGPVGWISGTYGISSWAGGVARVSFVTTGDFRWGILGEVTA